MSPRSRKNVLASVARRQAAKAVEATELRDAAIRDLHADGVTLREIGELVGMSHVGVLKIVNKG